MIVCTIFNFSPSNSCCDMSLNPTHTVILGPILILGNENYLHVLADTHTFFAVTPQMWLSTLWAKICNRGRLFYRLTLNFIVKKFPQCKTVNFIGNLIIINYPEHLFLHYHHYEKVFISTQTVLNNVYTNTDTSMTVQYLPTISAGLFYKPKISTCGTRGKVRGSPTSLVFILWGP